jgi:hypothetical protein
MFSKLEELVERFVVAQEKMAEASLLMAKGQPAQTKPEPYTNKEDPEFPETPEAPDDMSGWNPLKSRIMKRYTAEKLEFMKSVLEEQGIEVPVRWNGAKMHQKILELAKDPEIEKPQEPAAPVMPEPVAPETPEPEAPQEPAAPVMPEPVAPIVPTPEPAAPEAPIIGIEEVRTALNALAKTGVPGREAALRILKDVGGVTRLTDAATGKQLLPEDRFQAVYVAAKEAM